MITLITENITYISITNSLESWVPTIVLKYSDFNYSASKFLRANSSVLYVELIEPMHIDAKESTKLIKTFIINNIKQNTQNREYIMYEIEGQDLHITDLIKNVNYSNDKTQGKLSPYNIIADIANRIGYIFDTYFVDTSKRIDLITSQTMNAMDIIDYCLRMGVSEKDPPTYFITRLLDSTRNVI